MRAQFADAFSGIVASSPAQFIQFFVIIIWIVISAALIVMRTQFADAFIGMVASSPAQFIPFFVHILTSFRFGLAADTSSSIPQRIRSRS